MFDQIVLDTIKLIKKGIIKIENIKDESVKMVVLEQLEE
jgi:hypothetical protein